MTTTMIHADQLIRHAHIISMDQQRRIFLDGAIAIHDGRIAAIGPDRELSSSVEPSQELDVHGAVVHPGFVDAHAHTGLDLIRGLMGDNSANWAAVENPFWASMSRDDEYLGAQLACMEMVANGTTLYCDTGSSFALDATVEAIQAVGMRGIPGHYIADQGDEIQGQTMPTAKCLERLEEQVERYPFRSGATVRCAVTLSGMTSVSDELLAGAKALAERRGVPMIMHQSWSEEEVAHAQAQFGKRPVEHLGDVGVLGSNLTLIHMIHLDQREVELVARSGTRVVHCPAASIRRAMGAIRVGRIPEMLEAGVVVGLGSDGHSGKHDLARQAYLAATLHREKRGVMPTIAASTAMEMITVNSATALGMQNEVGSLEVGKYADIVIRGLDGPECRPRFRNPVSNLVYYSLSRTVDTVLISGKVVFEHGNFTGFEVVDMYRRLDSRCAAIETQLKVDRGEDWPTIE